MDIRELLHRAPKFLGVGTAVFFLSVASIFFLVSILGMHPTLAFVVNTPFTNTVNFCLSRRFTWKDRQTDTQKSALRFTVVWLGLTGLRTVLFSALVAMGLYYQFAHIAVVPVAGVIRFFADHKWTFAERTGSKKPLIKIVNLVPRRKRTEPAEQMPIAA